MEWRRPSSSCPKKAKVTQSQKNIMPPIFWNFERILLVDFKECNTTVTGEYYACLLHRLRDTIEEKCLGKLSRVLSHFEGKTSDYFLRGRLNELLCAVRLQRSASAGAPHERYHLDPGAQEDVKQFLSLQQRGMAHLLDTARKDLSALNTIAEGMARLVRT
ncbi:unnamed protein product [Euphydryas editha]|uniref:Nup54 C-terminal interacting domain-containing protein n=1 Tax=Euphydryas editha TaxID=104508 RepID=A0AAU9UKQ0_EUPED|nr:unnamed protein product [Euphydryas editha]